MDGSTFSGDIEWDEKSPARCPNCDYSESSSTSWRWVKSRKTTSDPNAKAMNDYATLTQLSTTYGVSRAEMAQWLVEIGLLARSPTEIAQKGGWCKVLGVVGGSLVLWHRQKTISRLGDAKKHCRSRCADKTEKRRGIRGNRSRPSASGTNDDWTTPDWLFNLLDDEFRFTVDAAASAHNAKLARFFTQEQDGLRQSWVDENVWINPPYAKTLTGLWVRKAYEESRKNATVTMLLPAWTHADWYHRFCLRYAEIRFIEGWVPFRGQNRSNTQVCMVAIFRPEGKGCLGPSIRCALLENKRRNALTGTLATPTTGDE